jgi:hypothetical protein
VTDGPAGTLWNYTAQVRENTRLPLNPRTPLLPNPEIGFVGRARRDGDEQRYATPWTETVQLDAIIPAEGPQPPRSWSVNAVGLTPAATHAALLAAAEELRQQIRDERASWTP